MLTLPPPGEKRERSKTGALAVIGNPIVERGPNTIMVRGGKATEAVVGEVGTVHALNGGKLVETSDAIDVAGAGQTGSVVEEIAVENQSIAGTGLGSNVAGRKIKLGHGEFALEVVRVEPLEECGTTVLVSMDSMLFTNIAGDGRGVEEGISVGHAIAVIDGLEILPPDGKDAGSDGRHSFQIRVMDGTQTG